MESSFKGTNKVLLQYLTLQRLFLCTSENTKYHVFETRSFLRILEWCRNRYHK